MSTFFLAVPLTIFMLFVAPIWLWLHYSKRGGGELSQGERQRLARLTEEAQQMRERIQALEQILDAEHRDWRNNL